MSLSLNNSTITPLLTGTTFIGKDYDNILDFVEINVSIKCNVGYTLTYLFSQDKINIDYQTSQVIAANAITQFYKFSVNDRYFKLKIEATNGTMTTLNVQTIYKASLTVDGVNNIFSTKKSFVLSNNVSIPAGTNATTINLSNINCKLITIYGNSSAATTFTVLFSHDGITWFLSQYSYISPIGNFGFAIPCCPMYVTIQSLSTSTVTAYLDCS